MFCCNSIIFHFATFFLSILLLFSFATSMAAFVQVSQYVNNYHMFILELGLTPFSLLIIFCQDNLICFRDIHFTLNSNFPFSLFLSSVEFHCIYIIFKLIIFIILTFNMVSHFNILEKMNLDNAQINSSSSHSQQMR